MLSGQSRLPPSAQGAALLNALLEKHVSQVKAKILPMITKHADQEKRWEEFQDVINIVNATIAEVSVV